MLLNWFLGFFAIGIWTANYLVYFAPDIRAWYRRPRRPPYAPERQAVIPEPAFAGPLPPRERRPFPPPVPQPPVHDAEIIPFPTRRRASRIGRG